MKKKIKTIVWRPIPTTTETTAVAAAAVVVVTNKKGYIPTRKRIKSGRLCFLLLSFLFPSFLSDKAALQFE